MAFFSPDYFNNHTTIFKEPTPEKIAVPDNTSLLDSVIANTENALSRERLENLDLWVAFDYKKLELRIHEETRKAAKNS